MPLVPPDPSQISPGPPSDEYIESVLVGGPQSNTPLQLVDHDPSWAERYRVEYERIICALGDLIIDIAHVGSTAVPGLLAKPIIDIAITVNDPTDEQALVAPLKQISFNLRIREHEFRHLMFRTAEKDVQLHVWAAGSDHLQRQLEFRDWLRAVPEGRDAYTELKRNVSQTCATKQEYTKAKSSGINDLLLQAHIWASQSSSTDTPSLKQ